MAEDSRARFYQPARLGSASEFARDFGGLAISNVKEVGHRFRLIQADPLALKLEEERRSTNVLPERVNQGANFLPVCFLEIGMRQVRAVCKIETKTTDANGVVTRSEAGTGFLVGPNLLLTNNHVIDSLDTAKAAWCLFNYQLGVDSLLGFFGGLGRHAPAPSAADGGLNSLETIYSGEGEDFDVGIWNVEWLTDRYEQKLERVAAAVADLNIDVWVLLNSTPPAARALVERLRTDYELPYDLGLAEELEDETVPVSAVIWNTMTVGGGRVDWPRGVGAWFEVDSAQFAELAAEPVQGPLFERFPARFRFWSAQRPLHIVPFEFSLVPLQLDAVGAESGRRRMASRVLAEAIARTGDLPGEHDWMIAGVYNAALATDDFRESFGASCAVMAAEGEGPRPCALAYLRGRGSALERVYASTAFTATMGANEAMEIARDRELPLHVRRLSDEWPALVRLTLHERIDTPDPLPSSLERALQTPSTVRRRRAASRRGAGSRRRTSARRARGAVAGSSTRRGAGRAASRRRRR